MFLDVALETARGDHAIREKLFNIVIKRKLRGEAYLLVHCICRFFQHMGRMELPTRRRSRKDFSDFISDQENCVSHSRCIVESCEGLNFFHGTLQDEKQ